MLGLARAMTRYQLDLETLDRESDDAVRERLLALRGVGRWTAEYVLLRGLGRLHMFPADDVGAQKRLAHWLGRARPFDYEGVRRAVEPWQPYARVVYFRILLDGLLQHGLLENAGRARPKRAGYERSAIEHSRRLRRTTSRR
jgi:DNA-3-methyladenine glycosylase II